MSKTWLLVGAVVLIGGIAWYVMKKKKTGANASA